MELLVYDCSFMSYNLLFNQKVLFFFPLGMKYQYRLTGPGNSRGRLFRSGSHLPILSLLLTEGEGPFFPEIISDPFKNTGHTDTTNRTYDDKDSSKS